MKKTLITCALSLCVFSAYAQEDLTVDKLAAQAETKAAFKEMVGKHHLPDWVTKGGTSTPAREVKIQDKTFWVLSSCKPHDCATERVAVLYSPAEKKLAGLFSAVDEKNASEKLTWLNVGDEESIDGKTILYAALTGSLENHPDSFNYK